MAKLERLGPVDTAWLRMDRPGNLMTIVGVLTFSGRIDFQRLQRTLAVRLSAYRRFRQKIIDASIRLSSDLLIGSIGLILHPSRAVDYAQAGVGIAGEIAKLALMSDDTPTRFKGKPGIKKRVAWSEPIALPEIKAVGRALGCSVNDLLLSAVAGALRAYLMDKGDPTDGVLMRALIPVNLRRPEEKDLGNRFGLITLDLPIGVDHPLLRLYETRRLMEEQRHSYQAVAAMTILGAVGLANRFVQKQVLDMLAAKASVVMTNVPGPQLPLFMAGSRIEEMIVWVPQSGDIGMGVSILSYDGKVQFGLATDAGLVPDPERIIARFAPEFEKLLYLVLLEPWEALAKGALRAEQAVAA